MYPSVRQSFIVPIQRWSLQEPVVSGDGHVALPDVAFVEPMLRRRLSSLSRMTLRAAYDCAHDIQNVRLVFASRHGELGRTTSLLENIAVKEELSPLFFSLAVLNASAGLFSTIQKNHAPAVAVSAGQASFGYGLLQAYMLWMEEPAHPVLFVYADEPVPAVYGDVDCPGNRAHALGLLLADNADMRIRCETCFGEGDLSQEGQSLAFLRCLEEPASEWRQSGMIWCWTREGHC